MSENTLKGMEEKDALPTRSAFTLLKLQVEAILFAAETALELSEIRTLIASEISLAEVRMVLKDLMKDYEERAFFLYEVGGKYQLRTREEHSELLRKQFASKPRSLSKSSLETLAIIAYRQPVTRAQINVMRSVDSSSILSSLKEKDLIFVSGQRKEVGSPLEYRTTQKFLEIFGLTGLKDLPSLRSLQLNQEEQRQVETALAALHGEEPPLVTASDLAFPDDTIVEVLPFGENNVLP